MKSPPGSAPDGPSFLFGLRRDQAKLTEVLRRRAAKPTTAKPPIIMAQLEGSGTGVTAETRPHRPTLFDPPSGELNCDTRLLALLPNPVSFNV